MNQKTETVDQTEADKGPIGGVVDAVFGAAGLHYDRDFIAAQCQQLVAGGLPEQAFDVQNVITQDTRASIEAQTEAHIHDVVILGRGGDHTVYLTANSAPGVNARAFMRNNPNVLAQNIGVIGDDFYKQNRVSPYSIVVARNSLEGPEVRVVDALHTEA